MQLCPPPDPHPRRPRLALPAGATDCHAHIFGPAERYPFADGRKYTPPEALLSTYLQVLETLGVVRAVIVQPSVYGTDNRSTLDAIAAAGDRFRGVAVVEPSVTEAELQSLHDGGVRGVRFNLHSGVGLSPTLLESMAERIGPLGWHLQVFCEIDALPALEPRLAALPVPVVIDHMGLIQGGTGVGHPGFQALLRLVRGGAWVKLSGAYRLSRQDVPYADVAEYARALAAAAPERCVWGTDWPHTSLWEKPMPNDGDLVDVLADWLPDEATRKAVLADNPARLYGFPPA